MTNADTDDQDLQQARTDEGDGSNVQSSKEEAQAAASSTGAPADKDKAPQNESLEEANARLQRELRDARREAGKTRVNAKERAANEREDQIVRQLLGMMGRDENGEKQLSVEDLSEELQRAQKRAHELELRESVRLAAAGEKGVDPVRLLKNVDFLDAISDLEPDDADGIKAAMQSVLDESPWLRVEAPAARRSGTEMSGGPGEGAITKERFDKMSGSEQNALFKRDPELYRQLSES